MKDKLPLLTMTTSFILLGIILGVTSMPRIETHTTTFNVIFRYGVSGAEHPNELNTLEGIFIKDMVNKEPVSTKLDLTQEEIDTIYNMMTEIDFFSYPKSFKPTIKGDIFGIQTPFMVYYLEYQDEYRTKSVSWNDEYIDTGDVEYQNLNQLARMIIFIIEAKPEYKKLPKPTAGYL